MSAIRYSLFVCLLIIFASADAASTRIYRTVDEQGNVVFTDVPPKDDEESEQVVIENPNTFESKEAAPETDAWVVEDADASVEPEFSYADLSIVSPQNDEPVRENSGNVTIIGNVSPRLQSGHTMRLLMDGSLVQEGRQTTFAMTNVDRGTHVVTLEIADDAGNVIKRSPDSTFHMLRYAIRR